MLYISYILYKTYDILYGLHVYVLGRKISICNLLHPSKIFLAWQNVIFSH